MEYKPHSDEHDPETDAVQEYMDLLLGSPEPPPVTPASPAALEPGERRPLGKVMSLPLRQEPEKFERRRADKRLRLPPFAESEPPKVSLPLPPIAPPITLVDEAVEEPPVVETSVIAEPAAATEPAERVQPKARENIAPDNRARVDIPTATPVDTSDKPVADVDSTGSEAIPGAQPVEAHRTEWLANGRPYWAQERFDVLLFKVGGLSLAVPLVELGTIYPMDEPVTPIFGQVDWFMGLMKVKGRNLATVDTAQIVMPERYQAAMADGYHLVISINQYDWGLAVDSVAHAITLNPADVRWRTERSKRPWLAGTVVDHMCALLDIGQLARMFSEYKPRRR